MIVLGTNASRVLDWMGFDFDRGGAVECNSVGPSPDVKSAHNVRADGIALLDCWIQWLHAGEIVTS
jgi:hypothetical protein